MKGMEEGYATHEGCQGEDDPNYSEIERPCGLKDCPGTRIQSFSISKSYFPRQLSIQANILRAHSFIY